MNDNRIHTCSLKKGISQTKEFERKGLASHAVNVGTKCGHGCKYCSTGAMLRMHQSFKECGEDPFGFRYAIVDPDIPEKVAKDAHRIRKRGMIQLCTVTDAWAPEAQEHQLGRKCLEGILNEPDWSVRILTKNSSVAKDLDLIQKHRDRILVGLSITGTLEQSDLIEILEPHASSIKDRMWTMRTAAQMGLRTYGMFCPLLPGIADTRNQIDQLIQFAEECQVEEIYVEPVNPRGRGLRLCQEALELWGYEREAKATERIRRRDKWSQYVVDLIKDTLSAVRKYSDINKLKFLLYSKGLIESDQAEIIQDDEGVIWL